jgi:hypothetical protein
MDCSYCRLRYTCDKYAEALRTPSYIAGCCTAFTFDTSLSDDAFVYRVRQPMTNGDRIRAMTDEELTDIICCPFNGDTELCLGIYDCIACCLKWLKQPCEVDHDTD